MRSKTFRNLALVSVTALHDDLTQVDVWSTALLCLGILHGMKTANKNHIKAFFIGDIDGKLVDPMRDEYRQIHEPVEE